MRIATWNINGLRARLDFIKIWLQERDPDIVGLQELKMTDDIFPHDELAELGYHAITHGQKAWNGVAILSKHPVEAVHVGLPGQEDQGARFLAGRTADLTFATVYCPNGKNITHEDYPQKLQWFDALISFIESNHSVDESLVLCGDFNIVPTPLDSWSEQKLGGGIFHTDQERARFQSLLDWGFHDLHREYAPEDPGYSWWDYRGGAFHKKQGLRIDVLLGTPSVRERLQSVRADRDYRKKKDGLTASDHAPVFADLT